jgi:ATP-binding cassette subfamily F protein 3
LENQLSSPLPAAQMAETGRRLKALAEEVTQLEERWLVLTAQLEATV